MKLWHKIGILLLILAAPALIAAIGTGPAQEWRQAIMQDDSNAIRAALTSDTGSDLTFTRILVNTAGDGNAFTLLAASTTGKVNRLHSLVGTVTAAGTVYIGESNYDTSLIALTGTMSIDALGGMVLPFTANPNGCITTDANCGLVIVSAGSAPFRGWAIVSQD